MTEDVVRKQVHIRYFRELEPCQMCHKNFFIFIKDVIDGYVHLTCFGCFQKYGFWEAEKLIILSVTQELRVIGTQSVDLTIQMHANPPTVTCWTKEGGIVRNG